MEGLLQIWRTRYAINATTTVADLRPLAKLASKKAASKKRTTTRGGAVPQQKRGRHVAWKPGDSYALLRGGIAVSNEAAIDALLLQHKCDDAFFYLFKHTDPNLRTRNALVPIYEAAYYCSETDRYVRVQKCHLRQAYARAGRTNAALSDSIMDDGLPYQVDRHTTKATAHKKRAL
jgi:hypothetical protein